MGSRMAAPDRKARVSVDRREVERIAELARLRLDPSEVERLTREMNRILEHAERLTREASERNGRGAPRGDAAEGLPPRGSEGGGELEPDPLERPPDAFAPEMREGFFVVPPPPGVVADDEEAP